MQTNAETEVTGVPERFCTRESVDDATHSSPSTIASQVDHTSKSQAFKQ